MKEAQKVMMYWPWTQHFVLAQFFLTLVICVIATIEMLGPSAAHLPLSLRLAAIVGWTVIGFNLLRVVIGISIGIAMAVTGNWKQFMSIMKGK